MKNLKTATIPHAGAAIAVFLAFASATISHAQEPARTAADQESEQAAAEKKTVVLSKFVVQGEGGDSGYITRNTLAGTRSAERLINIPQNIQIVNAELLKDLNQTFAFEAIKYASSGVVRRSNRTDDAFIRGFRTSGFLRDGVQYTGGTLNSVMYDVDRIEVVKGPAALLYGQAAATGGAINYVTKRPTATANYSVRAMVGTNEFMQGELNASGPTSSNSLRYRVTLGARDTQADRRFGYYQDSFIGGGVDWDVGRNTTLMFDFSYAKIDSFPDFSLADATGVLADLPDDYSNNEDWAGYINHSNWLSGTLVSQLTPTLDLRIVLSYKYDSRDGSQPVPVALLADGVTLQRRVQDVLQISEPKTLQIDLLKSFELWGTQNKLGAGVQGRRGSNRAKVLNLSLASLNIQNPIYGTPPGGYENFISDSVTSGGDIQTSIYIQDQMTLMRERLILVGGWRYNSFESTSTNLLAASNANTSFRDDKGVTRLGVIYKPITELALYYNNSESFVFQSGKDYLGRDYSPSVGTVDEFGVKVEGFGGALYGSAAYFTNQLTNVRTFILLPGMGNQQFPVQGGTETTKGFEIDLGINHKMESGVFNLTTSYYQGESTNATGARPQNTPESTFSGFAKYTFRSGSLNGFGAGFGAYHVSDRLGTANYTFPPYTVAIANLSYQGTKWSAALSVENVFDEIYVDGSEGREWLFTGERRGVKLSVEYHF